MAKNTNKTLKEMNSAELKKAFLDNYKKLTGTHGRAVWDDFIIASSDLISCLIDENCKDERLKELTKTMDKYNKDEQFILASLYDICDEALNKNPYQDFLGEMFMELELGNKFNGQFFTPYNVSKMMADLNFNETVVNSQANENGYITVCDPTCGSGTMLIAGAHSLDENGINPHTKALYFAQDISDVTARMCYIQLSHLGLAAVVCIGNTLTEPKLDMQHLFNPDSSVWRTPNLFHPNWVAKLGTINNERKMHKGEINEFMKIAALHEIRKGVLVSEGA